MSVSLLARCFPGEIRIAAASDGILLDYALWRPGRPDGVGDLLRGRIDAVLPALGGAFVLLGDGAETGFLPLRDGTRLGEGDSVLVRISRGAQGGKGPRLALAETDTADRTGRTGLVARGPSPLERLATQYPDAPIFCDDPALPASLPGLRHRIRVGPDPWPPGIAAQAEALAEPELALPGGMRASIHPTPALVAIDMDGGGSSGQKSAKATAQFAANRAAIGPLLHQIRLRNLGGAILLDLAGLPSRKRSALRPEIEAALERDPLRPKLLGFTALGLAEILRPRIHPPLHELLAGPHAAALAALAEAARFAAAPPHRLPDLLASIDVAAALDGDPVARAALAARAGRPISMRIDPSLPPCGWSLRHG
ncbi:ribonuclease E/G [Acetobacteraceae bacterium KSS8]|uniref:Ribonuclease E/G n=1 Tax=Endosaccharibacter trunci TaxID=2812733 RepID=A0ABT1WAD6_9PROT|nr:ribonuclease E/G [Acetobacteraceae bacterium KSS8]